jgi:flagellar protein FliO/FliZ
MSRYPGLSSPIIVAAALLLPACVLAAGPAGVVTPAPPDLWSAALRMTLGLAAVLALLGGAAWLSRRYRVTGRLRSGLIEVMSGISLGTREKVVLIRVGREQVLVGVSPAGMRTLHVISTPLPPEFAGYMESEK